MATSLRITLIAREEELAKHMAIRLQSKGYQVVTLTDLANVMGLIYSDPSDIVIVDLSTKDAGMHALVKSLKSDSYFSTIPLIGIVSANFAEAFDWENNPLDDFISHPINYPELFTRINLSMQRIQRIFDTNPLTRLPGNTSIQQAVEKVLGKPMAVCYLDINNFKPYNDVYGFSHGDEVLRMLSRIIFNAVKESGGGFTGHIGGDDFVFIVPIEHVDTVCTTIINNFTAIISDLFDEQDKLKGFYIGLNRKGQEEHIPLLGVSIAVVPTALPQIKHFGKVAEVAAELKNKVKKTGRSCYLVERRREMLSNTLGDFIGEHQSGFCLIDSICAPDPIHYQID